MNGRSRLDRYQNLRSSTSENDTNVNDRNASQRGPTGPSAGSQPSFRSGYSRQTSRSRLYQTSEYDSLLKEHEDFLKSLDEQFGIIEPSPLSSAGKVEKQTVSPQQPQPPHIQEYSQPAHPEYQPGVEDPQPQPQQPFVQPMPQPGYMQPPFGQPVQPGYTQQMPRVSPEQPQQYIQQPYGQPMPQPGYGQPPYFEGYQPYYQPYYYQPVHPEFVQPTVEQAVQEPEAVQPSVEPAVEEPAVIEPAIEEPVAVEPETEPVVEEPAVIEPVTAEATATEAVEGPAVEEPVEVEPVLRATVEPVSELEQPETVYVQPLIEEQTEIEAAAAEKPEAIAEEPEVIAEDEPEIDDIEIVAEAPEIIEEKADAEIETAEETVILEAFVPQIKKPLVFGSAEDKTFEEKEEKGVIYYNIAAEKPAEKVVEEEDAGIDLYDQAYQSMLRLYPDLNTRKTEPRQIAAEYELIEDEDYIYEAEEFSDLESVEIDDIEEIIAEPVIIDPEIEPIAEEPEELSAEEISELEPVETDELPEELAEEEIIEFEPVEADVEPEKEVAFEFKPDFEIEEAAERTAEIEIIDESEGFNLVQDEVTDEDDEVFEAIEITDEEILEFMPEDIETGTRFVPIDETQDIIVVDDEEDYAEYAKDYEEFSSYQEKVFPEAEIKDLELLDEDFVAEELDDQVIEIIDEKDSVKVMDSYLNEPEVLPEQIKEFEPVSIEHYADDEEIDIFDDENFIDDIVESQPSSYTETNVFKFIDDILVDVKNDAERIERLQPKQDFFNVEEDKTIEDISRVLSGWNLDELDFVEEESMMPRYEEKSEEVLQEAVYQPTYTVQTPVYYDNPVNVEELTQKLESERALRQQMLEQTKQIKLQVKEYENELDSVNTSMSKTNKILNFVLTLLIMTLFVILFVIGFWFAQERGLI